MKKIVIFLEGGLVQDVLTEEEAEVLVVDCDIDGADEADIVRFPYSDGRPHGFEAAPHFENVQIAKRRVKQLFDIAKKS